MSLKLGNAEIASNGQNGVGIQNVQKTSTSGVVDTYTITKTDSTTSTFTVTNSNIVTYSNIAVPVSAWQADLTYEAFGYRAALSLAGAAANMVPSVTFGINEVTKGIYAPIAEAVAGYVYIYAADLPEDAITIPSIILMQERSV